MYKASTGGAPISDQPKQRRVSSTDSAASGGQSSKSTAAKRFVGASMTDITHTSATSNGVAVTHALANGSGVTSGDESVVVLSNGHLQRRGDKASGKKHTVAVHHRKHLYGNRLPTTTMTHANGTGNGCADSDSTTSSSDAIAGATGVRNGDADQNNNSVNAPSDRSGRRRDNVEELLKVYFPVTLRVTGDAAESHHRRQSDANFVDGTARRSSGHRSQNPSRSGSAPRRIRSAGSRQSSTRSSSSSTSNGSFDRIYLAAMDDAHLGSPPVLQSSPYEEELVQLRLKMLRMEEDRHREQRQLADDERSRGPQQHWYAMRTVEFHREAQRNNQLVVRRAAAAAAGPFRCKPCSSSSSSSLVLDFSALPDSSPTATLTPAKAALFVTLSGDHR